jgi:hypothetical protein
MINRKKGHFALETLEFLKLRSTVYYYSYSCQSIAFQLDRIKFLFPSRPFFKIDAGGGGAEPILAMVETGRSLEGGVL